MRTILRVTLLASVVAGITSAQTTGPVITAYAPRSVAAGGGQFTLQFTGFGFFDCQVASCLALNWTSSRTGQTTNLTGTAGGQGTSFNVLVPATLVAFPDAVTLSVTGSGGTSGTVPFSVTVPVPVITSLLPPSAVAGGPAFTLTINGSGFFDCLRLSCLALNWQGPGGNATLAVAGSSTQLIAQVPAPLIANVGTATLTLTALGGTSAPVLFSITSPVPVIASLTPASLAAGSSAFTLTVNGSGFISGSAVRWNGSLLTTTFASGTQLTAAVPGSLLITPGTVSVTVVNPNEQLSNSAGFAVVRPSITSLNPASVQEGGNGFTLTVSGSNFIPSSTINLSGSALPTTYISSTQLSAPVPASSLFNPVTFSITVTNTPAAVSNGVALAVTAIPVVLTSLQPAAANAGDPSFTLTLFGSGYQDGAVALWNGSPLVTTFVRTGVLTAIVPASLVTQKGSAAVTVRNPDGNISNTIGFLINAPRPAITSIAPSSAPAGSPALTMTVTGTGFASGATVWWNSSALGTTFGSPAQLTAIVPASLLTQPGSASVTVVNPDGSVSNAVIFTIGPLLPPVITSISPSTAQAGGPGLSIAVTGSGFVSGSAVQWNGSAISTSFVSANQLTATVPASLIAQPITAPITVLNPIGGLSNSVPFTVTAPPPVITAVSPSGALVGSAGFALAVSGSGFVPGSIVQWNGTALGTTSGSGTQLTANVPAALLTAAVPVGITVVNPDGIVSNLVSFTLRLGPAIASLAPAAADAAGPAFTLTVVGSRFVTGSIVQWNGVALATSFVNAGQLTANVTADLIATPGSATVAVTNPNGDASNVVKFAINPPAPPGVIFRGPATAGPMQQPAIVFSLANAYPFPITGQAVLTFKPDTVNPVDTDPAIQFASGGTTFSFTMSPNSTIVPSIAIQTGSTAGTITVSLKLQSAGQDIPAPDVVIQILRSAPVIRTVTVTRNGSTLQIVVAGYSTSREVTRAVFHFATANGANLQTTDLTLPAAGIFTTWFTDKNSVQYGTQFTYSQTFNIQGDANAVGAVTVTLSNSVGASQPVTGN